MSSPLRCSPFHCSSPNHSGTVGHICTAAAVGVRRPHLGTTFVVHAVVAPQGAVTDVPARRRRLSQQQACRECHDEPQASTRHISLPSSSFFFSQTTAATHTDRGRRSRVGVTALGVYKGEVRAGRQTLNFVRVRMVLLSSAGFGNIYVRHHIAVVTCRVVRG